MKNRVFLGGIQLKENGIQLKEKGEIGYIYLVCVLLQSFSDMSDSGVNPLCNVSECGILNLTTSGEFAGMFGVGYIAHLTKLDPWPT